MNHDDLTRLIRIDEVSHLTGLCRAELYRRIRLGAFPRSIPLGGLGDAKNDGGRKGIKRSPVAWDLREVQAWIDGRIAARGPRTACSSGTSP